MPPISGSGRNGSSARRACHTKASASANAAPTIAVMAGDAELVERGGHGDYLFGDSHPFTPVKVTRATHARSRCIRSTSTSGFATPVTPRAPPHTTTTEAAAMAASVGAHAGQLKEQS